MKNALRLFFLVVSFVMASVVSFDSHASPTGDHEYFIQISEPSGQAISISYDVAIQAPPLEMKAKTFILQKTLIAFAEHSPGDNLNKHAYIEISNKLPDKPPLDLFLIERSRHDNRCNLSA